MIEPTKKSGKRKAVLILVMVFLTSRIFAQSFTLGIQPALVIPTGPVYSAVDEVVYDLGFKVSLQGLYRPGVSGFVLDGIFDYTLLPVAGGTQSNMSLLALGIGPGYVLETGGRFSFNTALNGGYFLGLLNGETGGNFFVQARAGGGFALSSSTDLNLSVDYSYYFAPAASSFDNAFSGISIALGVSYKPGSSSSKIYLEMPVQKFDAIFPVLHATYDSLPLGSVTLLNNESGPVEDVRVSYFLPRYMDSPRQATPIRQIGKGEEIEVDLYALLDKTVLDETEGTAANAEILVNYKFRGIDKSFKQDIRADILYRNALTWDDDRKAASFVTAKEPSVLTLSRNSLNVIREYPNQGTDIYLRQAMAVYESLRLYGMSYVIDPDSSYEERSTEGSLDFLQFPVETLTYQAGDCDDLSVLYSSLLESLSIETAFITTPGHIYMAFALDTDIDDAADLFPRSQSDLIHRNGKLWVPVEITLVQSSDFVEAWHVGAAEWQKYNGDERTGFWPVREAWNTYKPVGLIASSEGFDYPEAEQISSVYGDVLTAFITREIRFRILELEEEIEATNGRDKQKKQNTLGILYARNGMYNDAISVLRPLADGANAYTPAQLNLANLYYLTDNLRQAAQYYRLAVDGLRNPASAYLGLAMVENKLGNYDASSSAYNEFALLAPNKAPTYAYLSGAQTDSNRASSALGKTNVLWEKEE